MSHLKRQATPKSWAIERKGTTYVVKPRFSVNEGVPLLIVMRNMLKLGQDRSEVKKIIHSKQVLVNEKSIKDEKNSILFLDTLNVLPMKKAYRLEFDEKGKFCLNEIKESEANSKIAKIINKKTLKGKKTQLNLSDGRNFISELKCNINDSVEINLREKKIEKCLPLKEKAKIIVFAGKHIGKKGEVTSLNLKEKTAQVKMHGKEINILIKQLMVIE